MNIYSRKDVNNIINDIFDFIDNGIIKIEDKIFVGHPGLYFFHSKEDLLREINNLLNKDNYNKYDIYYLVNKLIKYMLGKYDSHTKIYFENDNNLPIRFKIYNDRVYVIEHSSDIKNCKGGILISVNGVDIIQILKELEGIISFSTKEYLNVNQELMLSSINALKSLPSISSNNDFIVFKILVNNEVKNIVINCRILYKPIKEKKFQNYSYEILDNAVIVHYNSCQNKEGMEHLINNLNLIRDIDNYIIDIRNNAGGSSTIIKPLLEFLKGKNIVVLINEKVFSSGRMAYVDLKNIGAYSIGSDISTSLNCFGNVPGEFLLKDLDLFVKRSSTYWYYDENLLCHGFEKDTFSDYFRNRKELLEPKILHPDEYIIPSIDDILNNRDPQLEAAINYFSKVKRL